MPQQKAAGQPQGTRIMPEIGISRRQAKRIQNGRHSEHHNHHPTKYVSYCPICEPPQKSHPQGAPHIVIGNFWKRRSQTGFCKAGHLWELS